MSDKEYAYQIIGQAFVIPVSFFVWEGSTAAVIMCISYLFSHFIGRLVVILVGLAVGFLCLSLFVFFIGLIIWFIFITTAPVLGALPWILLALLALKLMRLARYGFSYKRIPYEAHQKIKL